MTVEDPELDELVRDDHPAMARESRDAGGRTTGGGHEGSFMQTRHGFTVTLRIKADRRRLVTHVDPASERRRR